jgi:hypothetical protein
MKIQQETIQVLERINFPNRYLDIYRLSLRSKDSPFEDYSNEEVIQVFKRLGYQYRFYKSEKFFGLKESYNSYEFVFNISLRYGRIELIWSLKKDNEKIRIGGPWNRIIKLLGENNLEIKYPTFGNYNELEELSSLAFSL